MCGRKTLTRDMMSIIEELAIEEWENPENYFANYNVSPTQNTPVLLYENKRVVRMMRWGLIPSWAKEESIGNRMINARSETLLEKPSFRNLVGRKRCAVIADGYYEWRKESERKIPYYIQHPIGKLLPMACLWEQWISPENKKMNTYTIITTNAAKEISFIHDRMPVILDEEKLDVWVRTENFPTEEAIKCLVPYQSSLKYYTVSSYVNSPRNNSSRCIDPA